MKQRLLTRNAYFRRTLGLGLAFDYDGEITGSGLFCQVETPRWLRLWCERRIIAPPPDPSRVDVSADLIASMMITPNLLGAITMTGITAPEISWAEDRL